jgi:hypothetical protein
MQKIELAPQANDPSLSPVAELWNESGREKVLPEKFESVMGRTLGSRRDPPDEADASDKLRVEKHKTRSRSKTASPQAPQVIDSPLQVVTPRPVAAPTQADAGVESISAAPSGGAGDVEKLPSTGSGETESSEVLPTLPPQLAASESPAGPAVPPAPNKALDQSSAELAADVDQPIAGTSVISVSLPGQAQGVKSSDVDAGAGKFAMPGMKPDAGQEVSGISSAQQVMAMQKAEKINQLSGSTEQNLPVPPAGFTGDELPAKILHSASSFARHDSPAPGTAIDSMSAPAAGASESATSATSVTQLALESPLRSLERMHDLVSVHASRLRDSGADSLEVVIKPGPGMQMSLNLQMRDGTVDVRATLHRGDFDFLNRHWGELQQQLESRGVRISQLVNNNPSTGSAPNSFQSPSRQKEQPEILNAGEPGEFAVNSSTKPGPVRSLKTSRGWKSWA